MAAMAASLLNGDEGGEGKTRLQSVDECDNWWSVQK